MIHSVLVLGQTGSSSGVVVFVCLFAVVVVVVLGAQGTLKQKHCVCGIEPHRTNCLVSL